MAFSHYLHVCRGVCSVHVSSSDTLGASPMQQSLLQPCLCRASLPAGQELRTAGSLHVCVCSSRLPSSTEGRDKNLISDAVPRCLTPSSVLARLCELFAWQPGESDRQEPLRVCPWVTARPRHQQRWHRRVRRSPAPEPQPWVPCGEEQGHRLKTQQGCKERGRKERQEPVVAGEVPSGVSTDCGRNKAHWGCREQGEKGSKRRRVKEPVMSSHHLPQGTRSRYLSINTASKWAGNSKTTGRASFTAFVFPSLPVASIPHLLQPFDIKTPMLLKWVLWGKWLCVYF